MHQPSPEVVGTVDNGINVCVCVWEGRGVGRRLHLQVHVLGFGLRALVKLLTRTKGRGAKTAAANPHHLLHRIHSLQLSVEGGGVVWTKGKLLL